MNGLDLEYLEQGEGVPVVFSHGGRSDLRYWEPQRETFGARHRFIAYSHRYHGGPPWPTQADFSADAHARDLLAIIRAVGRPVHLVGFSSAIALRAVLRAPELVRSLVTIEPNVPWLLEGDLEGDRMRAWWRTENERVLTEAANDPAEAARLWFELVNNRGRGTFVAQPEAFRRMWLDNSLIDRPTAATPDPVRCAELGAVGTPTLVVGAEYGMPYSRAIVERVARCVPNCRFVVVPAVTHFMSYQQPDVFNSLVLEFLAAN